MIPDEKVLLDNLGKIAYTLDKAYIPKLTEDYSVWPFADKYNKDTIVCPENNIRILQVDRWVFDKKEKPGDCFKNMLSLFADGDHSLAVVILRRPVKTEMYFVIKNIGHGRNEDSKNNGGLSNRIYEFCELKEYKVTPTNFTPTTAADPYASADVGMDAPW